MSGVMSSSTKTLIEGLFVLAACLGTFGLWAMKWQIRNSRQYSGTFRLSPDEIKRVVRIHRKMFPDSVLRRFVAFGSLAAALAGVGMALFVSSHGN